MAASITPLTLQKTDATTAQQPAQQSCSTDDLNKLNAQLLRAKLRKDVNQIASLEQQIETLKSLQSSSTAQVDAQKQNGIVSVFNIQDVLFFSLSLSLSLFLIVLTSFIIDSLINSIFSSFIFCVD